MVYEPREAHIAVVVADRGKSVVEASLDQLTPDLIVFQDVKKEDGSRTELFRCRRSTLFLVAQTSMTGAQIAQEEMKAAAQRPVPGIAVPQVVERRPA